MKNDRNGLGIFFRILAGLTVGLGIFSGTLYAAENARAVIGSESIIEALTPKPQPKTRSLRNLRVEPVPPPLCRSPLLLSSTLPHCQPRVHRS